MKCHKCFFCISSDLNSYHVNCELYGEDIREKFYCRNYMTKKEKKKYEELKAKIDKKTEA